MSARTCLVAVLAGACGGGSATPSRPVADEGAARITGGTAEQRAWALEAVIAAERVYAHATFRELLAERDLYLRAVSDSTHDGESVAAIVTGSQVASWLAEVKPREAEYRIVRRLRRYALWQLVRSRTTAETAVCGGVRLLRLNVRRGATYVNTITHENTHRVGMGSGALGCDGPGSELHRFEDQGHDRATRAWLVSYVVGDLAECVYSSAGDLATTRKCFEDPSTVDGACRRYDECCAPTEYASVEILRSQSSRCESTRAEAEACSKLARSCDSG